MIGFFHKKMSEIIGKGDIFDGITINLNEYNGNEKEFEQDLKGNLLVN